MLKIAVLGAGVNGLTCAVQIKEKYKDFQVTVISEDFSPNTTGDGSGGLWLPYLCGNTPEHLIEKWGTETYRFIDELWREGGCGVSMLPIFEVGKKKEEISKKNWLEKVYGYNELSDKQLEYFSKHYSDQYIVGQTFTTFVVYPPAMLSYLRKRFEDANGQIINSKITSLQDPVLEGYDVIINCTGLGARYIVPDEKVIPIRGQVIKIKAPWINACVMDKSGGYYILPNVENCVIGGTHQKHNYSREVNQTDQDHVMDGCKRIIPGLEHATVIAHWAGLRPGRDSVRLETEQRNGKFYIHNYGHGGSGFTLFWGCGTQVLEFFDKYVSEKFGKSKL